MAESRDAEAGRSLPAIRDSHEIAARLKRKAMAMVQQVAASEPCKVVALKAGTGPKAVKHWRSGETGISLEHALMLALHYPEVREWFARALADGWDE